MSEYNIGDRVKVVRLEWEPTEEDKRVIGVEGTVRGVTDWALRVELDEVPEHYQSLHTMSGGLLFVEGELEKL